MTTSTGHFFSDSAVMFGRSMRHILRSPDTVATSVVMPVAVMLMIVYVFGGAITVPGGDYIDYMLPGIILMTVATGVTYTAYRMFNDKKLGIFDRFRSMPIAQSSPLWGNVLSSVIANAVSVAIVVAVALLIGFRSSAGIAAWLAVAGLVVLFTLALTWVAVIAGTAAKTSDGATAFSYPLIFLPFVSSAFVPTDTMPWALRIFAENQPVTPLVNSIRALLEGQPLGNEIWVAVAWCVGILIVANAVAVRLYRKTA
ncbi:ABC transporter permease [Adlercreutzia sp. R7]|uniref:Transport permease protein n=1 Tax=Adlercreutzia wanghongyangiae TaxID=3111451 RepID=A0ABU6IGP0_9ACTN|nr:ABC transporter permease [Adlercreutzia sp. R7]